MDGADAKYREKVIVRTSMIGIAANIVLVLFKAAVGFVTNSIAVMLDAVNNLSDALSSIITIAGTKLANKEPDKKHPYGHGRIEYLSQLVVAAIVLYAGITAAVESVKKIIFPEAADYSIASLIIIGAAVAVKIVLGIYVGKKGREVKSGSLEASGSDAFFDAVLSASVLFSAVIYILTGVILEAWVGAVIAVFIIRSGFEMIRDAVDEMLGVRVSGELASEIKHTITEEPEVQGVYDLIMHNYGPDRFLGSAHIEVSDTLTASEIDTLTRRIQDNVYKNHAVIMTAVGIYSVNTSDDEAEAIRTRVRETVMSRSGVIQFHGFYIDIKSRLMSFDVIIDFDCDRKRIYEEITEEIKKAYPDYHIRITLDSDMSDS